MTQQKQIEDIDELVLPDFSIRESLGFKFVYKEAIDPEYASNLIESLKEEKWRYIIVKRKNMLVIIIEIM